MVKSKAFVDTTILTNSLIKFREEKKQAKAALSMYETTELPVYAIKEFKAGPLDYVKYLYNKLLETESIGLTIIALTDNFRQRNRQATALRLFGELCEEVKASRTNKTLKAKYGRLAEEEAITYDSVKYETKLLVFKAWKKRRTITTKVVDPLPCYQEVAPIEKKNGDLSLIPKKCVSDDCCLTKELKENKRFQLSQLIVAIDNLPEDLKNKPENTKRRKLLREIGSKPGKKISDSDCRNLGDAIFALFCPKDADILTTNTKDHEPLAKALGKTAVSPQQIIK